VIPVAAERVSQLKLFCRTGVSACLDQVRTRSGRRPIPLWSMKIIVRPSVWDFLKWLAIPRDACDGWLPHSVRVSVLRGS
jgi:hypothetical protein